MQELLLRPLRAVQIIALVALLAMTSLVNVGAQDATPSPVADESSTAQPASSEVTTELPPPDIPASNQYGWSFDLDSKLTGDLENVPREAAVYALDFDQISIKQAQKIVKRLEIGSDVQDHGDGTYEASGDGQVYIAPDLIQYYSLAQTGDGDLPSDEDAIGFAREWLRQTVLLPKNADDGRVLSRSEETHRVVVEFLPETPEGLLSAYPSVSVTLGPDGVILETASRWSDIDRQDLYQLRPVEDAWNEVKSGESYVEIDVSTDDVEPGSTITGDATFDAVEIAYTTAGPPGGGQYLEPIFVFSGKVKIDGLDKSYPIRAYVPAIANSGAPVG